MNDVAEHREFRGGPSTVPPRVRATFAILIVAAGCFLSIFMYDRAFPVVSQVDEFTHFDYLERVSRFDLPRPGDTVRQLAMRTEACRGLDRGDKLPPCSSPILHPNQFQEFGNSAASGGWPVYYFVTGVLARVLQKVTGIDELFVAARYAQTVWMFLAWWGLFFVLKRIGVPRLVRASIATAIVLTPLALGSFATINPDAAQIGVTCALVIATFEWIDRPARSNIALIALCAFVGLLIDRSNIMGVGLVALFLCIEGLRNSRRSCIVLGAVLGLASLAWVGGSTIVHEVAISRSTQVLDMPTEAEVAAQHVAPEIQKAPPTAQQLWTNFTRFFTPISHPYVPTNMSTLASDMSIDVLNNLGIASVAALALLGVRSRRNQTLAISTWAMMMAGPLVAWSIYRETGTYFLVTARFAGGLCVGVAIAVGALTLQSKALSRVVVGITILSSLAIVWTLATVPTFGT